MSSSTTCIEDLPPEIINELFKYLQLKDLAACLLVNKRWHSIHSTFKLHSLAAINNCLINSANSSKKWCHTDQNFEEVCSIDNFIRLVDKPIVSNLRYLAVFENGIRFDLNKLNRLSQLIHLEIYSPDRTRNELKLNLPVLKVLAVHQYNDHFSLEVDCPRLDLLLYCGEPENSNLLKMQWPETIRKLDTDMFGLKLIPFKNVECLVTREVRVIGRGILQSMPKLKELHFKLDHGKNSINFRDPHEFLGAKEQLKEFLEDVHSLRPSGFRFRFAGFELCKVAKLNQINFAVQVGRFAHAWEWAYLEFYLKNFKLIEPAEPVEFIYAVDYTRLMRQVAGKVPSDFFQKIPCIQYVRATEVADVYHFLGFLLLLKPLRALDLVNSRLGQEFYDQLPVFAHSLHKLEIGFPNKLYEPNLRFDFIGKLPKLSTLLIVRYRPSLQSMRSLVASAPKSVHVQVYFPLSTASDLYAVFKFADSMVWKPLKESSKKRFKTEKPDELLHFFEQLPGPTPLQRPPTLV